MQWPVLITAGVWLGVLLLQFACFMALIRFTVRERRAFERLMKGGGWSNGGAWVRWVSGTFPEDDSAEVFRREEALFELDYWLSRVKSLLFLQRLAVLSPLIGVMITAIGLLTLHPKVSQDATLSTILASVSPLFLGVLGGAVLAIVSQILLFICGLELDSVRRAGRDWFDHQVWRPRLSKTRAVAEGLSPILQALTTTVRDSAETFADNVKDLRETSQALRKAAALSQQSFAAFGAELKVFSEQVKAFESAGSTLKSAVGSFDETTSHLVKVVENGSASLTGRLKEVDEVLSQMRNAAASFREFANLKTEVELLKQTFREMKAIVDEFQKLGAMKEPLKEIQRILERAASSSKAVEELPERFRIKVGELSNQLLERQMGDLEDILRDILHQMSHTLQMSHAGQNGSLS